MVSKERANLHRRVPRHVNLDCVQSFREERVAQNGWTVTRRNRWFQLTAENQKLALERQKVTVCEQLDGTLLLLYRSRELAWKELAERPQRPRTVASRWPIGTDRVGLEPRV